MIQILSSWSVEEWTKIITASVALVAVIVGPLLQWRIARLQAADNISSKRQNWIDELRKDSAEFLQILARLEELRRPNPGLSLDDQKLIFDEMAAATARGNELGIRLKLRLNPKEDLHIKLVKQFGTLATATKVPAFTETVEQRETAQIVFQQEREQIIRLLQEILKQEWERVKKGN
jgi:hypothetical protein